MHPHPEWLDFRQLVEAAEEGVLVVDASDRIAHVNRRMADLLGLPARLILGHSPSEFLPPERRASARARSERRRRGLRERYEVPMVRADGTTIWVLVSSAPILDASGEVVGASSLVTDITERKQAEEELRASEERFRRLTENMRSCFWMRDAASGRLIYVNPAFEEIWGLPLAAVYRDSELWLQVVHPEDVDRIREADRRFRESYEFEEEFRIVRPDGQVRWIHDHAFSIRDEAGKVYLAAGIAEDVTDARRAFGSLQESEARFRAIFEQANVGMAVVSLSGRYLRVNPRLCEILGRPADVLLGLEFRDVTHPDDRTRSADLAQRILDGADRVYGIQKRYLRPDGSTIWTSLTVSLIRDADGKPLHFVSTLEDITEMRAAEEERGRLVDRIHHAQKLESLGVLAGGIAHDFNNLLAAIRGNVGLALSEMPAAVPGRERLAAVDTVAQHAAELTSQLLAYSGKGRFSVRPISLSSAVEEMAELLALSTSKKARLRFGLASDLPAVEADVGQIRQVVLNLVTNASEAIGEGEGTIEVSTGFAVRGRDFLASTYLDEDLPEGPYVFLRVADDGCGMTHEVLDRLFEPFFTTKFAGRGLGMAAVLGVVRGHRGAIRIESTPQAGTRVEVHFPASERPVQPTADPGPPRDLWRGSGTILVVDDDRAVLEVARDILERAGFRVLEAADGREAVDTFSAHAPDIQAILLDVTMPRLGGEEALEALRRVRPDARILLTSGYGEVEISSRIPSADPVPFLQKPYAPRELLEKLRALLAVDR